MENRKVQVYTAQMPPVSREYAEELDRRFRTITLKPGVSHDEIMYNAGQRAVIEYVLATSVRREVSGDPTKLRDGKQKLNFFQRLFQGFRQ